MAKQLRTADVLAEDLGSVDVTPIIPVCNLNSSSGFRGHIHAHLASMDIFMYIVHIHILRYIYTHKIRSLKLKKINKKHSFASVKCIVAFFFSVNLIIINFS